MPENKIKNVSLANLTTFAAQMKAKYAQKTDVTAVSERVTALENVGAQANVLESVRVNGAAQTITDKAVDITIPVKVSDLTNDSKFQTEAEVAAAVAAADHLSRKKVESLDGIDPTAEGADKFIYMVPKTGGKNGDKYDEYMVLDGVLEPVGDWKVDLSGYASTEAVDAAKTAAITQANADTDTKLAGYVRTGDFEEVTEAEILAMFADE